MLTYDRLEAILTLLPTLSLGVLGDLFLDQYWDLDERLTEVSLETGLPAYQVTSVRHCPGAAGTVLNNLVSLGVGRVLILSVIGTDGHGHELSRALAASGVQLNYLLTSTDRPTPTYTKPMLQGESGPARELNRLDIKCRVPLTAILQQEILLRLPALDAEVDALLVSDQVSEVGCGVVTDTVRDHLQMLGTKQPDKLLLADSRSRIGQFRQTWLKPNERECLAAVGSGPLESAVQVLVQRSARPVFCTRGELGILLGRPPVTPNGAVCLRPIPGYPVSGPVDTVGAGDSTSAGIAAAYAAGATLEEAAAFGCLVAAVTVQQLGTTGVATPQQLRQQWRQAQGTTRVI